MQRRNGEWDEKRRRVGVAADEPAAPVAGTVTAVNRRVGAVVLGKGDVGLAAVDNTSDANKPVSVAQQVALNGKLSDSGDAATGNYTFTAPIGTTIPLTVSKGSAGVAPAWAGPDVAVFEGDSTTNATVQILSGTGRSGGVGFSRVGTRNAGVLAYDHAAEVMSVVVGANAQATFSTTGFHPFVDNTKSLGLVGARWSNIYSASLAATAGGVSITGAMTATGLVTASSAQFTGGTAPAGGTGAEVLFTGGIGYLLSFNRTAGTYQPAEVLGSTAKVTATSGNVTIAAAGVSQVFSGTGLAITGLLFADGPAGGTSGKFTDGTNSTLVITHPTSGVVAVRGDTGSSLNLGASNTDIVAITTSGAAITGALSATGTAEAGMLKFNGGGTPVAGTIYSDGNWGMLNWPKVAGAIAAHGWLNLAGSAIMTLTNAGALNVTGSISTTGSINANGGDITTYRTASPTTGAYFFGNTGSKYLFYTGTQFELQGGQLFINGSQAWHSGNVTLASGTYTPTGTGVTNVAAVTPYVAQWSRVGNNVTVSGLIDIQPTASGFTQVQITLPVASDFTSSIQAAGTTASGEHPSRAGSVAADAVANKLILSFNTTTNVNANSTYVCMYQVL